jgi:beta-lactam-binding protein with PASTA domain
MLKVWDGSDWKNLDGVKYYTNSGWDRNNKSKVRSATQEWLPKRFTDKDTLITVKWNVAGRTPPNIPEPVYDIPNIVGLTQAAAITAIQTHFNIGDITYITTTNIGLDGKVSSQFPQPLMKYPANTFINFVIYSYKTPTAVVPQLNGKLKTEAETAITSLGLVVGAQDYIETYDVTLIGKVVPDVQYPTAGTTVDVGTLVTFDYYKQKPYATMPNLVGQDEYSVYSLLSAVNLDLGTRTTIETTNKALEGKVESQQYNAGQQLQTGTTVNYRVYVPNTNTTVPNIVGKTPSQASALLQAAELWPGTETTLETVNVSLEGTIASQQYGAGTTRPVDSTVNYVVYIPNTTTTVPNIVGQTLANATSMLTTAELILGYQYAEVETTNTTLQNKIAAQTPNAGTTQPVNSSVNYSLYVAPKTATVPNIVGQTPSVAAGTLSAVGLSIGYQTSTTYTSNQSLVGTIYSQSPASGSTQNLGTSINYVTYALNPNTTVPNIVGMTYTDANTALTNAGLNVGTVTETPTSNAAQVGTVQSQGTASGSTVLRGSSINYVKYRAYISTVTTQTKTGTAYVWSPTWQSTYYGTSAEGAVSPNTPNSKRTINPESLYFGKYSSTSTTGSQVSLVYVSDSALSSACNAVSGNRPYTITGVTFNYGLATGVGNSSKPVYLGYYAGSLTSAPSSISSGSVNKSTQYAGSQTNGSYYSINLNSTLRSMCFTSPAYPLIVNAQDTAASSYGAVTSASTYFSISIQWTETTTVLS